VAKFSIGVPFDTLVQWEAPHPAA